MSALRLGSDHRVSATIRVRPAVDADMPFVFDGWLKSFRMAHAAGPFAIEDYKQVYSVAIQKLLQRAELLIACNPELDDQLYGFLAHEKRTPPVVHYVYVKQPFRKHRIATLLMAAADIPTGKLFYFTYKSPGAGDIAEHWRGATFDPFKARFTPKE